MINNQNKINQRNSHEIWKCQVWSNSFHLDSHPTGTNRPWKMAIKVTNNSHKSRKWMVELTVFSLSSCLLNRQIFTWAGQILSNTLENRVLGLESHPNKRIEWSWSPCLWLKMVKNEWDKWMFESWWIDLFIRLVLNVLLCYMCHLTVYLLCSGVVNYYCLTVYWYVLVEV